jgi:hypothetical protein
VRRLWYDTSGVIAFGSKALGSSFRSSLVFAMQRAVVIYIHGDCADCIPLEITPNDSGVRLCMTHCPDFTLKGPASRASAHVWKWVSSTGRCYQHESDLASSASDLADLCFLHVFVENLARIEAQDGMAAAAFLRRVLPTSQYSEIVRRARYWLGGHLDGLRDDDSGGARSC